MQCHYNYTEWRRWIALSLRITCHFWKMHSCSNQSPNQPFSENRKVLSKKWKKKNNLNTITSNLIEPKDVSSNSKFNSKCLSRHKLIQILIGWLLDYTSNLEMSLLFNKIMSTGYMFNIVFNNKQLFLQYFICY